MALYDYQKPAADTILAALNNHRCAVDASDTGVGKTHVACEVAARLGMPVLVVCPKIVRRVWRKTMQEYGVDAVVENYEMLRTGNTDYVKRRAGKNFEWMVSPDTLIVWDEFHRAKAPNTRTSSMARAAKPHYNLMLSATLAESPLEMRALGYLTGLHNWTNWWEWCRKNGCKSLPWGGMYLSNKMRDKVLTDLHNYLFPNYGARIRIPDLGNLFPETQISAEAYEFDADIQGVYDHMEEEITKLVAEAAMADVLVAQLRARQEVELRKVPGLVKMAEDGIAEGMSVVIFTNFKSTLEHLTTALKCNGIHGDQTEMERDAIVEAFQTDEARCIVVNIQAGGVGMSLHDITGKHPRLALVCPTYGAKSLKQALGRVHRANGKSRSIQRIVFAAGTIEESICESVKQKLYNLDLLNDGDLQTEVMKSLNIPTEEVSEPQEMTTVEELPTAAPTTPVKTEPDRAHAKHSPSTLKNKLICPGWINNNEPGRDMTAADRGTRGHEAWEMGTSAHITDDPALKKAVDLCIKYSNRIPGTVFKEQRVAVLDQFGFFDRLHVHGDVGYLLDAKFAHNLYKADSPQFWAYLIGIWDDPRWAHLKTIEVHALHPFLDIIDIAKFDRAKDYDRLLGLVLAAVERAKVADPATYRMFDGCRFCGNAGRCGKLAAVAFEVASKYEGLQLPEHDTMHGSDMSDPAVLSKLLDISPALESAISGWKRAALKLRQEDGVDIPGYRLLERTGVRKITDANTYYQMFTERGGRPEDFAAAVSIGIGDAEQLWADLAPKGKKGVSKQELNDLLLDREAITLGENSFYLKKEKTK